MNETREFENINYHELESKSIVTNEEVAAIHNTYPFSDPLSQNEKVLKQQLLIDNEIWIQTYSGKKFFPLNPKMEDVLIEDIAHALSMQCRFTGHCREFYSIALHSVLVSLNCDKQDQLHALLHDASEAYICDLASPLKRSGRFEDYRKIEKRLQAVIFEKFGLNQKEPESVKTADLRMLATEARDLIPSVHPDWHIDYEPFEFKITPFSQKASKHLFLARFYELTD